MGKSLVVSTCNIITLILCREFMYELHDMIAYRYDIIRPLGKGSFGIVFKWYDYKEKDFIALKVVKCK